MSKLTELQEEVIQQAKLEIQDRPWFKGVCLDQVSKMSDEEIRRSMIKAVQTVGLDTMYWDAPDEGWA